MKITRYGIDAPGLVRTFFFVGVGLFPVGSDCVRLAEHHTWVLVLGWLVLAVSAYALGMCNYMLWGSLVTKVRGRDRLLDLVLWTGHEQVLDVGCGRGLLLVGAAHRLTDGHATGIDLWLARDQSANGPEAALENARMEGVADRVSVVSGDMRSLPFKDASFDAVVSHWAVHNVEPQAERVLALREMLRVLRPAGTIALNDIVNREEYVEALRSLGATDVRLVVASRWRDAVARTVSFGSFQPATVIARKENAEAKDYPEQVR